MSSTVNDVQHHNNVDHDDGTTQNTIETPQEHSPQLDQSLNNGYYNDINHDNHDNHDNSFNPYLPEDNTHQYNHDEDVIDEDDESTTPQQYKQLKYAIDPGLNADLTKMNLFDRVFRSDQNLDQKNTELLSLFQILWDFAEANLWSRSSEDIIETITAASKYELDHEVLMGIKPLLAVYDIVSNNTIEDLFERTKDVVNLYEKKTKMASSRLNRTNGDDIGDGENYVDDGDGDGDGGNDGDGGDNGDGGDDNPQSKKQSKKDSKKKKKTGTIFQKRQLEITGLNGYRIHAFAFPTHMLSSTEGLIGTKQNLIDCRKYASDLHLIPVKAFGSEVFDLFKRWERLEVLLVQKQLQLYEIEGDLRHNNSMEVLTHKNQGHFSNLSNLSTQKLCKKINNDVNLIQTELSQLKEYLHNIPIFPFFQQFSQNNVPQQYHAVKLTSTPQITTTQLQFTPSVSISSPTAHPQFPSNDNDTTKPLTNPSPLTPLITKTLPYPPQQQRYPTPPPEVGHGPSVLPNTAPHHEAVLSEIRSLFRPPQTTPIDAYPPIVPNLAHQLGSQIHPILGALLHPTAEIFPGFSSALRSPLQSLLGNVFHPLTPHHGQTHHISQDELQRAVFSSPSALQYPYASLIDQTRSNEVGQVNKDADGILSVDLLPISADVNLNRQELVLMKEMMPAQFKQVGYDQPTERTQQQKNWDNLVEKLQLNQYFHVRKNQLEKLQHEKKEWEKLHAKALNNAKSNTQNEKNVEQDRLNDGKKQKTPHEEWLSSLMQTANIHTQLQSQLQQSNGQQNNKNDQNDEKNETDGFDFNQNLDTLSVSPNQLHDMYHSSRSQQLSELEAKKNALLRRHGYHDHHGRDFDFSKNDEKTEQNSQNSDQIQNGIPFFIYPTSHGKITANLGSFTELQNELIQEQVSMLEEQHYRESNTPFDSQYTILVGVDSISDPDEEQIQLVSVPKDLSFEELESNLNILGGFLSLDGKSVEKSVENNVEHNDEFNDQFDELSTLVELHSQEAQELFDIQAQMDQLQKAQKQTQMDLELLEKIGSENYGQNNENKNNSENQSEFPPFPDTPPLPPPTIPPSDLPPVPEPPKPTLDELDLDPEQQHFVNQFLKLLPLLQQPTTTQLEQYYYYKLSQSDGTEKGSIGAFLTQLSASNQNWKQFMLHALHQKYPIHFLQLYYNIPPHLCDGAILDLAIDQLSTELEKSLISFYNGTDFDQTHQILLDLYAIYRHTTKNLHFPGKMHNSHHFQSVLKTPLDEIMGMIANNGGHDGHGGHGGQYMTDSETTDSDMNQNLSNIPTYSSFHPTNQLNYNKQRHHYDINTDNDDSDDNNDNSDGGNDHIQSKTPSILQLPKPKDLPQPIKDPIDDVIDMPLDAALNQLDAAIVEMDETAGTLDEFLRHSSQTHELSPRQIDSLRHKVDAIYTQVDNLQDMREVVLNVARSNHGFERVYNRTTPEDDAYKYEWDSDYHILRKDEDSDGSPEFMVKHEYDGRFGENSIENHDYDEDDITDEYDEDDYGDDIVHSDNLPRPFNRFEGDLTQSSKNNEKNTGGNSKFDQFQNGLEQDNDDGDDDNNNNTRLNSDNDDDYTDIDDKNDAIISRSSRSSRTAPTHSLLFIAPKIGRISMRPTILSSIDYNNIDEAKDKNPLDDQQIPEEELLALWERVLADERFIMLFQQIKSQNLPPDDTFHLQFITEEYQAEFPIRINSDGSLELHLASHDVDAEVAKLSDYSVDISNERRLPPQRFVYEIDHDSDFFPSIDMSNFQFTPHPPREKLILHKGNTKLFMDQYRVRAKGLLILLSEMQKELLLDQGMSLEELYSLENDNNTDIDDDTDDNDGGNDDNITFESLEMVTHPDGSATSSGSTDRSFLSNTSALQSLAGVIGSGAKEIGNDDGDDEIDIEDFDEDVDIFVDEEGNEWIIARDDGDNNHHDGGDESNLAALQSKLGLDVVIDDDVDNENGTDYIFGDDTDGYSGQNDDDDDDDDHDHDDLARSTVRAGGRKLQSQTSDNGGHGNGIDHDFDKYLEMKNVEKNNRKHNVENKDKNMEKKRYKKLNFDRIQTQQQQQHNQTHYTDADGNVSINPASMIILDDNGTDIDLDWSVDDEHDETDLHPSHHHHHHHHHITTSKPKYWFYHPTPFAGHQYANLFGYSQTYQHHIELKPMSDEEFSSILPDFTTPPTPSSSPSSVTSNDGNSIKDDNAGGDSDQGLVPSLIPSTPTPPQSPQSPPSTPYTSNPSTSLSSNHIQLLSYVLHDTIHNNVDNFGLSNINSALYSQQHLYQQYYYKRLQNGLQTDELSRLHTPMYTHDGDSVYYGLDHNGHLTPLTITPESFQVIHERLSNAMASNNVSNPLLMNMLLKDIVAGHPLQTKHESLYSDIPGISGEMTRLQWKRLKLLLSNTTIPGQFATTMDADGQMYFEYEQPAHYPAGSLAESLAFDNYSGSDSRDMIPVTTRNTNFPKNQQLGLESDVIDDINNQNDQNNSDYESLSVTAQRSYHFPQNLYAHNRMYYLAQNPRASSMDLNIPSKELINLPYPDRAPTSVLLHVIQSPNLASFKYSKLSKNENNNNNNNSNNNTTPKASSGGRVIGRDGTEQGNEQYQKYTCTRDQFLSSQIDLELRDIFMKHSLNRDLVDKAKYEHFMLWCEVYKLWVYQNNGKNNSFDQILTEFSENSLLPDNFDQNYTNTGFHAALLQPISSLTLSEPDTLITTELLLQHETELMDFYQQIYPKLISTLTNPKLLPKFQQTKTLRTSQQQLPSTASSPSFQNSPTNTSGTSLQSNRDSENVGGQNGTHSGGLLGWLWTGESSASTPPSETPPPSDTTTTKPNTPNRPASASLSNSSLPLPVTPLPTKLKPLSFFAPELETINNTLSRDDYTAQLDQKRSTNYERTYKQRWMQSLNRFVQNNSYVDLCNDLFVLQFADPRVSRFAHHNSKFVYAVLAQHHLIGYDEFVVPTLDPNWIVPSSGGKTANELALERTNEAEKALVEEDGGVERERKYQHILALGGIYREGIVRKILRWNKLENYHDEKLKNFEEKNELINQVEKENHIKAENDSIKRTQTGLESTLHSPPSSLLHQPSKLYRNKEHDFSIVLNETDPIKTIAKNNKELDKLLRFDTDGIPAATNSLLQLARKRYEHIISLTTRPQTPTPGVPALLQPTTVALTGNITLVDMNTGTTVNIPKHTHPSHNDPSPINVLKQQPYSFSRTDPHSLDTSNTNYNSTSTDDGSDLSITLDASGQLSEQLTVSHVFRTQDYIPQPPQSFEWLAEPLSSPPHMYALPAPYLHNHPLRFMVYFKVANHIDALKLAYQFSAMKSALETLYRTPSAQLLMSNFDHDQKTLMQQLPVIYPAMPSTINHVNQISSDLDPKQLLTTIIFTVSLFTLYTYQTMSALGPIIANSTSKVNWFEAYLNPNFKMTNQGVQFNNFEPNNSFISPTRALFKQFTNIIDAVGPATNHTGQLPTQSNNVVNFHDVSTWPNHHNLQANFSSVQQRLLTSRLYLTPNQLYSQLALGTKQSQLSQLLDQYDQALGKVHNTNENNNSGENWNKIEQNVQKVSKKVISKTSKKIYSVSTPSQLSILNEASLRLYNLDLFNSVINNPNANYTPYAAHQYLPRWSGLRYDLYERLRQQNNQHGYEALHPLEHIQPKSINRFYFNLALLEKIPTYLPTSTFSTGIYQNTQNSILPQVSPPNPQSFWMTGIPNSNVKSAQSSQLPSMTPQSGTTIHNIIQPTHVPVPILSQDGVTNHGKHIVSNANEILQRSVISTQLPQSLPPSAKLAPPGFTTLHQLLSNPIPLHSKSQELFKQLSQLPLFPAPNQTSTSSAGTVLPSAPLFASLRKPFTYHNLSRRLRRVLRKYNQYEPRLHSNGGVSGGQHGPVEYSRLLYFDRLGTNTTHAQQYVRDVVNGVVPPPRPVQLATENGIFNGNEIRDVQVEKKRGFLKGFLKGLFSSDKIKNNNLILNNEIKPQFGQTLPQFQANRVKLLNTIHPIDFMLPLNQPKFPYIFPKSNLNNPLTTFFPPPRSIDRPYMKALNFNQFATLKALTFSSVFHGWTLPSLGAPMMILGLPMLFQYLRTVYSQQLSGLPLMQFPSFAQQRWKQLLDGDAKSILDDRQQNTGKQHKTVLKDGTIEYQSDVATDPFILTIDLIFFIWTFAFPSYPTHRDAIDVLVKDVAILADNIHGWGSPIEINQENETKKSPLHKLPPSLANENDYLFMNPNEEDDVVIPTLTPLPSHDPEVLQARQQQERFFRFCKALKSQESLQLLLQPLLNNHDRIIISKYLTLHNGLHDVGYDLDNGKANQLPSSQPTVKDNLIAAKIQWYIQNDPKNSSNKPLDLPGVKVDRSGNEQNNIFNRSSSQFNHDKSSSDESISINGGTSGTAVSIPLWSPQMVNNYSPPITTRQLQSVADAIALKNNPPSPPNGPNNNPSDGDSSGDNNSNNSASQININADPTSTWTVPTQYTLPDTLLSISVPWDAPSSSSIFVPLVMYFAAARAHQSHGGWSSYTQHLLNSFNHNLNSDSFMKGLLRRGLLNYTQSYNHLQALLQVLNEAASSNDRNSYHYSPDPFSSSRNVVVTPVERAKFYLHPNFMTLNNTLSSLQPHPNSLHLDSMTLPTAGELHHHISTIVERESKILYSLLFQSDPRLMTSIAKLPPASYQSYLLRSLSFPQGLPRFSDFLTEATSLQQRQMMYKIVYAYAKAINGHHFNFEEIILRSLKDLHITYYSNIIDNVIQRETKHIQHQFERGSIGADEVEKLSGDLLKKHKVGLRQLNELIINLDSPHYHSVYQNLHFPTQEQLVQPDRPHNLPNVPSFVAETTQKIVPNATKLTSNIVNEAIKPPAITPTHPPTPSIASNILSELSSSSGLGKQNHQSELHSNPLPPQSHQSHHLQQQQQHHPQQQPIHAQIHNSIQEPLHPSTEPIHDVESSIAHTKRRLGINSPSPYKMHQERVNYTINKLHLKKPTPKTDPTTTNHTQTFSSSTHNQHIDDISGKDFKKPSSLKIGFDTDPKIGPNSALREAKSRFNYSLLHYSQPNQWSQIFNPYHYPSILTSYESFTNQIATTIRNDFINFASNGTNHPYTNSSIHVLADLSLQGPTPNFPPIHHIEQLDQRTVGVIRSALHMHTEPKLAAMLSSITLSTQGSKHHPFPANLFTKYSNSNNLYKAGYLNKWTPTLRTLLLLEVFSMVTMYGMQIDNVYTGLLKETILRASENELKVLLLHQYSVNKTPISEDEYKKRMVPLLQRERVDLNNVAVRQFLENNGELQSVENIKLLEDPNMAPLFARISELSSQIRSDIEYETKQLELAEGYNNLINSRKFNSNPKLFLDTLYGVTFENYLFFVLLFIPFFRASHTIGEWNLYQDLVNGKTGIDIPSTLAPRQFGPALMAKVSTTNNNGHNISKNIYKTSEPNTLSMKTLARKELQKSRFLRFLNLVQSLSIPPMSENPKSYPVLSNLPSFNVDTVRNAAISSGSHDINLLQGALRGEIPKKVIHVTPHLLGSESIPQPQFLSIVQQYGPSHPLFSHNNQYQLPSYDISTKDFTLNSHRHHPTPYNMVLYHYDTPLYNHLPPKQQQFANWNMVYAGTESFYAKLAQSGDHHGQIGANNPIPRHAATLPPLPLKHHTSVGNHFLYDNVHVDSRPIQVQHTLQQFADEATLFERKSPLSIKKRILLKIFEQNSGYRYISSWFLKYLGTNEKLYHQFITQFKKIISTNSQNEHSTAPSFRPYQHNIFPQFHTNDLGFKHLTKSHNLHEPFQYPHPFVDDTNPHLPAGRQLLNNELELEDKSKSGRFKKFCSKIYQNIKQKLQFSKRFSHLQPFDGRSPIQLHNVPKWHFCPHDVSIGQFGRAYWKHFKHTAAAFVVLFSINYAFTGKWITPPHPNSHHYSVDNSNKDVVPSIPSFETVGGEFSGGKKTAEYFDRFKNNFEESKKDFIELKKQHFNTKIEQEFPNYKFKSENNAAVQQPMFPYQIIQHVNGQYHNSPWSIFIDTYLTFKQNFMHRHLAQYAQQYTNPTENNNVMKNLYFEQNIHSQFDLNGNTMYATPIGKDSIGRGFGDDWNGNQGGGNNNNNDQNEPKLYQNISPHTTSYFNTTPTQTPPKLSTIYNHLILKHFGKPHPVDIPQPNLSLLRSNYDNTTFTNNDLTNDTILGLNRYDPRTYVVPLSSDNMLFNPAKIINTTKEIFKFHTQFDTEIPIYAKEKNTNCVENPQNSQNSSAESNNNNNNSGVHGNVNSSSLKSSTKSNTGSFPYDLKTSTNEYLHAVRTESLQHLHEYGRQYSTDEITSHVHSRLLPHPNKVDFKTIRAKVSENWKRKNDIDITTSDKDINKIHSSPSKDLANILSPPVPTTAKNILTLGNKTNNKQQDELNIDPPGPFASIIYQVMQKFNQNDKGDNGGKK